MTRLALTLLGLALLMRYAPWQATIIYTVVAAFLGGWCWRGEQE